MDTAVAVSIAVFMAGVVFYAGRITARVDSLENDHERITRELDAIHTGIRRLEGLITHGDDA